MSELTEHQKLQEARRKDFETIEVPYRHLKQVIVGDETLEQTKAALEEFKTNKELKATGLRFNPNLQRWLNVARDRIIRWERDHPTEPEPKSELEPKTEKEPDKEPTVIEKTISDPLQVVSEAKSTIKHIEEPEKEDAVEPLTTEEVIASTEASEAPPEAEEETPKEEPKPE